MTDAPTITLAAVLAAWAIATPALADEPSPLAPTESIRPMPRPDRDVLEREIIETLRERLRDLRKPEVWA